MLSCATAVVEPNARINAAAIAPNAKLLNVILSSWLIVLATGGEQPDDAGKDYSEFCGPQFPRWPSLRTYSIEQSVNEQQKTSDASPEQTMPVVTIQIEITRQCYA